MNTAMGRSARYRREQRLSKVLLVVAAIVLFSGLFLQIAVRARISSQNKQIAALKAEVKTLSANAENLDLNINQRHNLTEIGARAAQLGMTQPDETQLRMVNLPAANGDTSTQTVSNDGEEIIG